MVLIVVVVALWWQQGAKEPAEATWRRHCFLSLLLGFHFGAPAAILEKQARH